MSFWRQGSSNPKRKFRFMVTLTANAWDGGSELWYAKSCTAPSVEVTAVEHMFSDHVFNFPGRAKWGDVEMVLVDPAGAGSGGDSGYAGALEPPNTVSNMSAVLTAFGYEVPSDGTTDSSYATISRNKIQDLTITIRALDDDGNSIETWTLHNAFPTAFKFGDFDYGTDDLREMNITWKYDWASVESGNPGSKTSYFGS